jgi:hypothetical protein
VGLVRGTVLDPGVGLLMGVMGEVVVGRRVGLLVELFGPRLGLVMGRVVVGPWVGLQMGRVVGLRMRTGR